MVDFGLLHEEECQGADSPDSLESDYELWSPRKWMEIEQSQAQMDDTSCLLGRRTYYV